MTELLLINGYTPSMVEAGLRVADMCQRKLADEGRRDILRRSKAGRAGRGGRA